jgi:hypothetical protein
LRTKTTEFFFLVQSCRPTTAGESFLLKHKSKRPPFAPFTAHNNLRSTIPFQKKVHVLWIIYFICYAVTSSEAAGSFDGWVGDILSGRGGSKCDCGRTNYSTVSVCEFFS